MEKGYIRFNFQVPERAVRILETLFGWKPSDYQHSFLDGLRAEADTVGNSIPLAIELRNIIEKEQEKIN
jgi:hypothetical protein